MSYLSGYRIMWMMVLFDLPTGTKSERKSASKFRNQLLDMGFQMAQFSVYVKFTSGKEQVTTLCEQLKPHLPISGMVDILSFTDKQYENIISFRGTKREDSPKNPDQYQLF